MDALFRGTPYDPSKSSYENVIHSIKFVIKNPSADFFEIYIILLFAAFFFCFILASMTNFILNCCCGDKSKKRREENVALLLLKDDLIKGGPYKKNPRG